MTTPARALDDRDRELVRLARALSLDAVESAGSGHPGTALALAPVAHLLFQRHLRHDPTAPDWPGRDRFVLSCGHASILLYTQLFLTGYGLTIEDLRGFRSLGSRTPGHPEHGHTPGVETTTGPLGQGLATAVGIALGLRRERDTLDPHAPAGASPFDRTVWVVASDGDLQEGITAEAGALAGHHRLGNLVVIFDDNRIQIEGATALSTSEDVGARFAAQGWHVERIGLAEDGDVDVDRLDVALEAARARHDRPTLVCLRSQIAWPAPTAVNTPGAHGSPLGAAETAATKAALDAAAGSFVVPEDALARARGAVARGAGHHAAWLASFAAWSERHPDRAAGWERARSGRLPAGLDEALPRYAPGERIAPRDASGATIQALAAVLPELWGGSADLGDSNRTTIEGGGSFLPDTAVTRTGRNVHWGVREHAMAAAMNGIVLAGSSRFFAGTFLVFSDYQRPAIRLAALMQLPVIHVWSHDSAALGADGPTHQPVEHLASLRAIPGFAVVRPADAAETVAAWVAALDLDGPVGLVLARQPVPVAATPAELVREGVRRGAYVVADAEEGDPDVVLVATGSEVDLAARAREVLREQGLRVRLVSMPCKEWFARQDPEYRESVLPGELRARVVVEAASPFGWHDVAGAFGEVVGVERFGVSAPGEHALEALGMTVAAVVAAATRSVERVAQAGRPGAEPRVPASGI